MSTGPESTESMFLTNYKEFAEKLIDVIPELKGVVEESLRLPDTEKRILFRELVLPCCGAGRDMKKNPDFVLPGVPMSKVIWESLSETTQQAVQEYLTILSFAMFMEDSGGETTAAWMEEAMRAMKEKMNSTEFQSISEKLKGLFGSFFSGAGGGGTAAGAAGGFKFPDLPEKFKRGQIVRLAEEIMKEFNPSELGLSEAELAAANDDPMKAFSLISDLFTKKPGALQSMMKRIQKKMQQKIQSGQIRPKEIAAEAEELMKHFTENSQFKDLMGMFKDMFGAEDPDLARATGNDSSARLSLVKERLKKKLAAKQGAQARK
jgi:hypothetical protein